MIHIKILTDFTNLPGARILQDGKKSGEEFYHKLLKDKFDEAILKNEKLAVDLDGVEGYMSSFLNEAFSLLGNEYGSDNVWDRLIIISQEVPKYIHKVKSSVYEKRN